MKPLTKNLSQRLNQTQPQIKGNARAYKEFGCSSTPAPTPPGTDRYTRKAGVGAGLYNNQIVGAGVRMEEVKIKDEVKVKGESQNQSQKQSQKKHRGKPPVVSVTGLAGFSTPFPEGLSPLGPVYFLNLIGEVGYERA